MSKYTTIIIIVLCTLLFSQCDYIPCGTETSAALKIYHQEQYKDDNIDSFNYDPETGKHIMKGYAVLQFWGLYNDGSNLYGEIQVPVQIADWA